MQPTSQRVIIIGAGIVGLATGRELLKRNPRLKLVVLEKEADVACHQTGHNSGVIHSGIYYKPGSAKALTCVTGRKLLLEFCDRHQIRYELCGKVVVATDEAQVPALEELHRRGLANGVEGLELIGPERLRELEPHAAGVKALHCPATGIVNFVEVARAIAQEVTAAGGEIHTNTRVMNIDETAGEIVVTTNDKEFRTDRLINCAGLFSDTLAGFEDVRIIPFRGEYYRLTPAASGLVNTLIYPVPDPRFPFLGVHFTRSIRGFVEAGPNAVLAFSREGYKKSDIDLAELGQIFSFKGFQSIAKKYWRIGTGEFYRSYNKAAFTKALQKLVPEIREHDLTTGGAGVRAQAVGADGTLYDDFVVRRKGRAVHVINAPSPAATASLAIAKRIADLAQAE